MNGMLVSILYFCAVASLVLITVFLLLRLLLARRKQRSVKAAATALFLSAALLGFVLLFVCSHPTYYKYNDWWVQGRTLSQVEARYGPFDIRRNGVLGYYIYTDNGPIMPDHLPHYYYLEYDDNGIVRNVYEGVAPGG